MTYAAVLSLRDALDQRERTAAAMKTTLVEGPSGGWEWREGMVAHKRTDFFRVIGRRVDGVDHLMMRQREHALVGLLVCGPPGARRLLLNTRAEPGLHGLCQFSTTVQSTPSNYERRHGGAATPHLEHFLAPRAHAVVHDSLQYDWGDYYHRKSKRVLIVETPELIDVDAPNLWVDAEVLSRLARLPHMLTSDLRVALATLAHLDRARPPAADVDEIIARAEAQSSDTEVEAHDVALHESASLRIHPRGINGANTDVVWASTTTTTREVGEWVQPLLAPHAPLDLALAVRWTDTGLEAAVEFRSAPGLDGTSLVYPARPRGGTVLAEERSSAEGGRFWQFEVALRVLESDADNATWVSIAALEDLATRPLFTSLELRLLMEVAVAVEYERS